MTKSDEYRKSARILEVMSGLACIDDVHKTHLKRGAKALDTLAELEKLNEMIPQTKDE